MTYQALARKWRPRRFDDVVGQEHVIRSLVNALEHDRIHHAFLFTGTRGVGKTTIARVFAKALNCERGVSAQPCGECEACRAVDEGRFVDLIEVDAASRTKVDDTRELLDNVQYAPTRGRYKVYLIDEVHMLSAHSFNALLKTLEEPPPHVKFLLATTDPHKLPVTVLSRCLQFNLKHLSAEQIASQLRSILDAEGIEADAASVELLARSADGSMRDALSLLDQAIAHGGGALNERDVRSMLGTLDEAHAQGLVRGLAHGDAAALLSLVAEMAERTSDFGGALDELLLALYHVTLAQLVPEALDGKPVDRDFVAQVAAEMPAEDVQLYYQIGLLGKRDLALAPDPRSGLEMTLLRMLAFRPAGETAGGGPRAKRAADGGAGKSAGAPPGTRSGAAEDAASDAQPRAPEGARGSDATPPAPQRAAPGPRDAAGGVAPVGEWARVVAGLDLSGLVRELASHTVLAKTDGDRMHLTLDERCARLLNREREAALREALSRHYGRELRLDIRVGEPGCETPARERDRLAEERQQAAVAAIENDPNVKGLVEAFDARINPESIRPKV
jgi:DNA polymerase-3 subunit gamma/tau